ncbi:MAG: hypothetical protein EP147_19255 [Subdoligranulum sp.]|nr:hypothetical protein [Subdoligranulum sp.]
MTTVLLHTGQTAPILEPRQPEMRVVRGGKHGLNRARQFAAVALHVIAAALLLGLIFSVVHSQARITELNGQINDTRTDLTAAQSEYDYLSTKMSDITSRASFQDVAEGQLGLVKADQSQIIYIQLEEQSVIEKTGSDAGRVLVGIRTAALNLLDSFNP